MHVYVGNKTDKTNDRTLRDKEKHEHDLPLSRALTVVAGSRASKKMSPSAYRKRTYRRKLALISVAGYKDSHRGGLSARFISIINKR